MFTPLVTKQNWAQRSSPTSGPFFAPSVLAIELSFFLGGQDAAGAGGRQGSCSPLGSVQGTECPHSRQAHWCEHLGSEQASGGGGAVVFRLLLPVAPKRSWPCWVGGECAPGPFLAPLPSPPEYLLAGGSPGSVLLLACVSVLDLLRPPHTEASVTTVLKGVQGGVAG